MIIQYDRHIHIIDYSYIYIYLIVFIHYTFIHSTVILALLEISVHIFSQIITIYIQFHQLLVIL